MMAEDLGQALISEEKERWSVAILATALAALGAVSFGFALGFSSPTLPAMQGSIFHDLKCGDDDDSASVSSSLGSLWSSILNIGGVAGALGGGKIVEAVGRRGALVTAAAPALVVGWAATALSRTAAEVIVARVVVGLGVGLCSSTTPVYIAETAPRRLRGALLSANQLAVTFGIFSIYFVGFSLPHSRREYSCGAHAKSIHPSGWRLVAWIGAGLGAALAVGAAALPETPTWLAGRGKMDAARRALSVLRGGCLEGPEARRELEDLAANAASSKTEERAAIDVFKMMLPYACAPADVDVACRIPLRISLALMLFQQFSGVNAVIFFAGDILGDAGMSNRDLGGVVVMAIQLVMTAVGVPLVDRLGRRTLLIASLSGMAFAATLMGVYFSVRTAPPVALVALVVYISSFAIGLGPLPWSLMAELLPTRARTAASAAATMINWLMSFVITESYASAVIFLTPEGTFFLFAAVCACGVLFVYAYLPETKGVSLDDIERLFARSTTTTPATIDLP
ncbi:hypothetical protein CTAYLR_008476 [Chrysophaeum taylorii]|uniref:Hexose transporter 1 n=1 Tax=Chrysophaeum taylorii TaxID=2483200 RepID=A0AAD7UJ93_9STRA|nr:hypothetical protein CTAYLR_008476 [Chrysophaeum taylorii]